MRMNLPNQNLLPMYSFKVYVTMVRVRNVLKMKPYIPKPIFPACPFKGGSVAQHYPDSLKMTLLVFCSPCLDGEFALGAFPCDFASPLLSGI